METISLSGSTAVVVDFFGELLNANKGMDKANWIYSIQEYCVNRYVGSCEARF